MNAICISLKGNIKCGSKITDVVAKLPQKMAKKPDLNDINGKVERNPYITNRFHAELGAGDPSRNVVEMIFRASYSSRRSSSSSKKKKIRRVVKVKNPEEVVAKFERYREEVKRSSMEHSRSVVDGNELLQFYGTTMSCSRLLSQLCTQTGCRVCRIIQSGFNTSYNKIHGIRVSAKSNSMSEDSAINGGAKNAKRAVIICRTIAAGGRGVGADGAMVVPNPAALLPCFLVIFD